MANPIVVVVPGSFSTSPGYDEVEVELKKAGLPMVELRLPTTQKRMPLEPATLQDDVDVIKTAVGTLLSQGREVVVLAHSYGGTPATEALAGLPIKRLIYLTAAAPKIGQSNFETLGTDEAAVPPSTAGYMHVAAEQWAPAILNDLPWEEAYKHVLKLSSHSSSSFKAVTTQAAYESVPVSYILTEKDYIIPLEKQQLQIDNIKAGSGKEVHVIRLDSGHCPNWSQPAKLAEIIAECARK